MVLQEEMCKRPQFTVIYPIRCARIASFYLCSYFRSWFNNYVLVPADGSLPRQCLLNQLKLSFIK